MAVTKPRPIIVIKKKGGHGGHHGGAWKVAYADFVTAMMSLFIVLWLMGSSDRVKKAVAGYFNDPKGTGGLLGTTMTGTGETVQVASNDDLKRLKDKLEQEIKARKELEKLSKQIEITITSEGLRIELLEGKDGTFYQSGSAYLSANGQELLTLLASELQTLPNNLLIEGHTDAAPYMNGANYSNWELSADRANSARRLLQADGVRSDQVTQVRGYADQLLRVKENPTDPSNRRISILVKNQEGPAPNLKGVRIVGGPTTAPQKGAPASNGPAAVKNENAPPAPAAKTETSAKSEAAAPAKSPTSLSPAKPTAAAQPSLFGKIFDKIKKMVIGPKKQSLK
jgi:chemotaxis protein MotB